MAIFTSLGFYDFKSLGFFYGFPWIFRVFLGLQISRVSMAFHGVLTSLGILGLQIFRVSVVFHGFFTSLGFLGHQIWRDF
jgi:hypothetical protein